jgi:peptidoglycan/LPS O-acetylase OafA/YrhL
VFGVHWQQFTDVSGARGPFGLKAFLERGNTGVALFFMLSAFLLSLRFWSGRWGTAGRPWIRDYAVGRALRLMPAYYLCIGAIVLASRHFMTDRERLDTALHVLFLHNLREANFYGLAPPFWTIAVQAQSYLWLPIVLVVVLRVSASWMRRAALLGGLVVASYAAHWFLMTGDGGAPLFQWLRDQPTVATHSLLAHVPVFLLGLLAAVLYVNGERERGGVLLELSVWAAAIAVLLILSTPLADRLEMPYGRYVFPIVPLLIMWIILAAPRTYLARGILESPPLRLLGVISFGIYVYHYPAMELMEGVMRRGGAGVQDNPWLFGVSSLVLTVAVAAVSFVLIESPLLGLGRPAPQPGRAPV